MLGRLRRLQALGEKAHGQAAMAGRRQGGVSAQGSARAAQPPQENGDMNGMSRHRKAETNAVLGQWQEW